MDELPNQASPNDETGDKKNDGQAQQIPPTETNQGIRTILISVFGDNLFRFFASIAFVSWMIHEFVFDSHKIFLFIAIIFGLAEAFYVLAHKILIKSGWIALSWMLYLICLIAIFRNESEQTALATSPTTEKQIEVFSKVAAARQWQPPELATNTEWVYIEFGAVIERYSVWELEDPRIIFHPMVVLPGGRPGVIPFVRDRRLYLSILTPFGDSERPLKMNNQWPIEIPSGWDRNFDSQRFEIVDDRALPVLQVRYDSPSYVVVNGVFVSPEGNVSVVFGDQIRGGGTPGHVPDLSGRKAWFKYPSRDHLGDLAN
jgi:hypothetical protein